MENPYAAPKAEIVQNLGSVPLYSPNQVMAGAFLGGPVGLIWFLRENFVTFGDDRQARKTLLLGVVLLVALMIIMPMLPKNFPSLPISIAYMITGQQVAIKWQMTRDAIDASSRYTFHSNGRVFGLGLLCLVASMILLVGPILLLGMTGLVHF